MQHELVLLSDVPLHLLQRAAAIAAQSTEFYVERHCIPDQIFFHVRPQLDIRLVDKFLRHGDAIAAQQSDCLYREAEKPVVVCQNVALTPDPDLVCFLKTRDVPLDKELLPVLGCVQCHRRLVFAQRHAARGAAVLSVYWRRERQCVDQLHVVSG